MEGGVCTFDIDRDTMKALWDNYYVPMVQGWFSAEGKFRSDAVKTGDLLCYVGSSSSVVYFPQTVTLDDETSYPIELAALPAPTFADGEQPCAPQQGAGFVVTKSDEKRETACVDSEMVHRQRAEHRLLCERGVHARDEGGANA